MKKMIALVLTLVMSASVLAGCGSSAASSEAAAGGEETFVFKHGFDLDYPPYSYRDDNGNIGGFDVEMAQAVCEYYGWE